MTDYNIKAKQNTMQKKLMQLLQPPETVQQRDLLEDSCNEAYT